MDRVILHCDCNGFYASVEEVMRPELRRVPMAVCGNEELRHGIILAKNQLAKGYNIKTAETINTAKAKCPQLVLVPPHHEEYEKYSKAINQIYLSYTDLVEPFGIDESWLDVTGSRELFGSGAEIADALRGRVKREMGLTISVGVSFNKVFAKLGSDYQKPDATTVFGREQMKSVIWLLPATDMLYVGKSMEAQLSAIGVRTIGQLAIADRAMLERLLGKAGAKAYDFANGLDSSPVRSFYDREASKSIGNGMTFSRNISGFDEIRAGVASLCDSVATSLRRQGLLCRTVQVQIKDPSFRVISRQKTLEASTHLARELTAESMELIKKCWSETAPIRMITISATNLEPIGEATEQLELFGENKRELRQKQEKLESAMDEIRNKYGKKAIKSGNEINSDFGL